MTRPRCIVFCMSIGALCACSPPSATAERPVVDLVASARDLFARYEAAIQRPQRDAIAGFYARDSVIRIINGSTARTSRAQLDTVYRTRWTPPAFFAWDSLAYDQLDSATVLVTGGFRWLRAGSSDTTRFLYAAILQARDSGVAIRFEHETLRPPDPR